MASTMEGLQRLLDSVETTGNKQKSTFDSACASIDEALGQIEQMEASLDSGEEVSTADLAKQLDSMANMMGKEFKGYFNTVTKLGKTIDEVFCPLDVLDSTVLDPTLLNSAIVHSLFREGNFEMGQMFLKEGHLPPLSVEQFAIYENLHIFSSALDNDNPQPCLEWVQRAQQEVQRKEALVDLEFRLHSLRFLFLLYSDRADKDRMAFAYAREHFPPFFSSHCADVERLMGSCLYSQHDTPYPDLADYCTLRASVRSTFHAQYWKFHKQPQQNPLLTSALAGVHVLPQFVKMKQVTAAHAGLVSETTQSVDLGDQFQYHSVFVCPVTKNESSASNPPVLLKCGHVISKAAMEGIARVSRSGRFKCPTCPREQTPAEALILHF